MAEKQERVGLVTLKNVRLSYPHLFKPGKGMKNEKTGEMQPGKYGAVLIIDPTTKVGKANLVKLKKAKEDVMEEKWGPKKKLAASRLCTKKYAEPVDEDGDVDEEQIKEEYVGMYLVSARNPDQPQILDNTKENGKWRRIAASEGKPYGGCYANVVVRLWAQDNDYGERVNASMEICQFYKHGEAFSDSGPLDADDMLDDDIVEGGDIDELDDYGDEDESPKKSKRKPSDDEEEEDSDLV